MLMIPFCAFDRSKSLTHIEAFSLIDLPHCMMEAAVALHWGRAADALNL